VFYFGISMNSARGESISLLSQLEGRGTMVTMVLNEQDSYPSLLNDDKYAQQTPQLDRIRKSLQDLENASDPILYTNRYNEKMPPTYRTIVIRTLAPRLAEVDPDFNKDADGLGMKRLVLSGHHYAPMMDGRESVMWGSVGETHPRCVFTLYDENGASGVLSGLAQLFPKAFLQVEDLCLSACFTAKTKPGDLSPVVPQMYALFKNLKTVWAYETESPGPGPVSNRQSSNYAICQWETASRPSGAGEAIDAASQAVRAEFRGNEDFGRSIVFIDGKTTAGTQ
jgi:hypothetical protein